VCSVFIIVDGDYDTRKGLDKDFLRKMRTHGPSFN
jgi:hypothetical protein